MATNYSGKTRIESDLIGEMEVPVEALYGVQTLRGIENFPISRFHLSDYPLFINGLAITKLAAAEANHQLGLLTDEQFDGISKQSCNKTQLKTRSLLQDHQIFQANLLIARPFPYMKRKKIESKLLLRIKKLNLPNHLHLL